LGKAEGKISRLQVIWADAGYAGKLIDWAKQFCNWILEIIERSDDVKVSKFFRADGQWNEHLDG
jgi:putative transposase